MNQTLDATLGDLERIGGRDSALYARLQALRTANEQIEQARSRAEPVSPEGNPLLDIINDADLWPSPRPQRTPWVRQAVVGTMVGLVALAVLAALLFKG
jgi:hypothetical protein